MKGWAARLFILLVLIGAGAWAWKVWYPSPENAVRKCLNDAARIASVTTKEGQLMRLSRAESFASHFTSDVEINIDIPGEYSQTIQGRDELLRIAAIARAMGNPVRVDLVDLTVTVAADAKSAEAHFTGEARLSGQRSIQAQEIRAQLVKVNRDWLIRHVETVRTLR